MLQEDLGWEYNTKQICKRAFSKLSILGKLKYAGICIEDLLEIYKLFIRSITEYCSVAFHGSLTEEQSHKLEVIQSSSLKVILADNYVSYTASLEMCNIEGLDTRREKRQLAFARRSLKSELKFILQL